jgi:hypothetical protein
MAGPSPAFLAQLNAGLAPDPFAAGAAAAGYAPAAPQAPAAPPESALYGGASTDAPPIPMPGVPQPAPAGPPAQPASAPPPPPRGESGSPYLQANPGDVEFAPVHTPGSPAREVPVRGPQQNALLERSFEHPLAASEAVAQRSVEQADRERSMYERQAEQFEEQQAAMMRVQARRQQELQQMRSHYMDTIDRLSNFQVDNNRLWNNSTTMDKIAALLLITMGAGGGGKESLTLKAMQKRIQDDVDSQKFEYETGLNYAKGQQTAYAMAMEQYGSEDAAYHAAMSAGQQAVAMKVAGMNAQWKGTDAQNKAQAIQGELLMQADQNKAAGLKYLQPTAGGTKYQMRVRGQMVPGLVSEERAQGYTVEHGVKPAERVDEALVKGGIDQTTQAMKLRADQAKAEKQHAVVLPNGETLYAQNDKQAEKAQTLSAAVSTANDLVNEAKQIRKGNAWLVPYSKDQKRLEAIQSELTLAFKDRGGLGALSGPDMDLALGATGDITSRGQNSDAKLDSFAAHTNGALRNYVKTIPGAPPRSSGVMPGSFKATESK